MFEDDEAFYQRRAAAELALARQAALPCAAEAHRQLAEAYLDILASMEPALAEAA